MGIRHAPALLPAVLICLVLSLLCGTARSEDDLRKLADSLRPDAEAAPVPPGNAEPLEIRPPDKCAVVLEPWLHWQPDVWTPSRWMFVFGVNQAMPVPIKNKDVTYFGLTPSPAPQNPEPTDFLRMWAKPHEARVVKLHDSKISDLTIHADGKTFATTCWDSSFGVWQLPDAKRLHFGKATGNPLRSIVFTGRGSRLVVGDQSGALVALNCAGFGIEWRRDLEASVISLTSSEDGLRLCAAGENGRIIMVDALTGHINPKKSSDFSLGVNKRLVHCRMTPDGKVVFANGEDGQVHIAYYRYVDADLGFPTADYVTASGLSPDGKLIALGDAKGQLYLFDRKSRKQTLGKLARHVFSLHRRGSIVQEGSPISGLAFTPDGKVLVAVSYLGGMSFWNVAERKLIAIVPQLSEPILAMRLAPDGRTLLLGDHAGNVRIWEGAGGR